MNYEQIDQARVDEAFRVIKDDARKNFSLEVARLAREAQEAEIERLREALKYIATLQPWESQSKFIIGYAIDKLKEKE